MTKFQRFTLPSNNQCKSNLKKFPIENEILNFKPADKALLARVKSRADFVADVETNLKKNYVKQLWPKFL